MAILYLILALVIAIIAVIFALQNTMTVTLAFLAWSVKDAPLSIVLLATLVIGILIGWLFAAPSLVKHTFRASGHRKRIGALEKELENHKAKLTELQKPAPGAPKPADRPAPIPATKSIDTDPRQHS
jgi:uncharacterized integral membrane protein